MRPSTLRIASAEDIVKATSLAAALVEHAPWCRTAPATRLMRIEPLESAVVKSAPILPPASFQAPRPREGRRC